MPRRKPLSLALLALLFLLVPASMMAQDPESYPSENGSTSQRVNPQPQNKNLDGPNTAFADRHGDAAIKDLEEEDDDSSANSQSASARQLQAPSQLDLSQASAGYSQARIVRLSYVEGDVRLDRSDGQGFIRAFNNLPLIEGARLWTEGTGRAEIEFEDGSTVRLTPGTILDLKQLRLSNGGDRFTAVAIERGEAYLDLKKHGGDEFTVNLNPLRHQLRLRKSSHFRVAVDGQGVEVAEFKGKLELQRPDGQRVSIGKNETVTLDFSDADRYFLARGINPDAQDSWDHARSEQVALLAANRDRNARVYSAAYYPGYSYGFADMYRYGGYTYAPGYGYVWRPYQVSLLWDPFLDGSWVWYPGYNYVFVSSYPWGWTPYHYGSWVHVNNIGWCWRPTGNTNFVSITNVINPPTGWRGPRPPRPGLVGGVVAVGANSPAVARPGVIDGNGFRGRDGRTGIVPVQAVSQDQVPGVANPGRNGWRGSRDNGAGTAVGNSAPSSSVVSTPSNVVTTPVSEGRGDVARFGRGRRDGSAGIQNGGQQSSTIGATPLPANDARSYRSSRYEGDRPMPLRKGEPSMQHMPPMSAPSHTSMPGMSAPNPAPAVHSAPPPAAASNGGRERRDK